MGTVKQAEEILTAEKNGKYIETIYVFSRGIRRQSDNYY